MSSQRVSQPRSQASSKASPSAARSSSAQGAEGSLTPEDPENEEFEQDQLEAFGLRTREDRGTITSAEQERLGVLQAKMDSFWEQRMERARAQPNLLEVLATASKAPARPGAIQAKGGTPENRAELSAERRPNRTGLPLQLKRGIENLSGFSLDHVRVHYNSPKPAQLKALAYTQGQTIEVAPGQERHLPHEAWHVVQQMQGRAQPMWQLKSTAINDSPALEQEADVMGRRALTYDRPFQGPLVEKELTQSTAQPVQRVRGGLEYTESSMGNHLYRYPGNDVLITNAAFATGQNFTIRGTNFTAFHVPAAQMAATVGAIDASDANLVTDGLVTLTNDTTSPEWKIEGHGGLGVTAFAMDQEITRMFAMRTEFKDAIAAVKALHVGDNIVFTPTANINAGVGLVNAGQVFQYEMAAQSSGAVQITVKHRKRNTIKRIAEVNAGKHLKGGAIDDDIGYLGKTDDQFKDGFLGADWAEGNKGYYARSLRATLQGQSKDIKYKPNPAGMEITGLTAEDVGIIKLMILSDAMAALVTRYDEVFGQTHDKNQQRYFAKSHRTQYIHALKNSKVPDHVLNSLKVQLIGSVNELMATYVSAVDLKSFNLQHINQRDYPNPAGNAADAAGQQARAALSARIQSGAASKAEQGQFRDTIFGANNALFEARLREVIAAYTDISAGQDAHTKNTKLSGAAGNRGTVISSFNYAPVDPTVEPGAVYEARNREIPMSENDRAAVTAALETIFDAAE